MSNNGKVAEGIVRVALKELRTKTRSTFLRLYDTTSASGGDSLNYLPEQPADFIFIREGNTFLIEVKSSVVKASLTKDMLAAQRGHFKIWKRAGSINIVVFIDLVANRFQIWPGDVSEKGVRHVSKIASGAVPDFYSALALVTCIIGD